MPNPSNKAPVTVRGVAALPEPDAQAQHHSQRLCMLIREEIDSSGGSIGFDRYMERALYLPGMGYYSAGTQKFGGYGDFVTAPEISPLFSRCLAHQCYSILRSIQQGCVLELGAGTGIMAAEVLQALEALGRLPERYYILELSAELRTRQAETLQQRVPHLSDCVRWLDSFPPHDFRGVVLANEVLDAMPVHCFRWLGREVVERRVGISGQGGLRWIEQSAGTHLSDVVSHIITELPDTLSAGYCSEINLRLMPWMQALGNAIKQAVVILIDYGYPRREYYHPQRHKGTLLCHYRHLAHEDPFYYPGLQDISANVDFTAVAEAADAAGMQILGYTSQAQFLLANGVAEIIADAKNERERWEYAQQIKRLTLPSEMGDRFQVMALGKAFSEPIQGFQLHDFASRL
jgi:SAM-dependent MidA family methyltransferase